MRKELLRKLSHEEKTIYRIEKSTNPFPNLPFSLLTFVLVAVIVLKTFGSESNIATIINLGFIGAGIIWFIGLVEHIIADHRTEKEWTKFTLTKIRRGR